MLTTRVSLTSMLAALLALIVLVALATPAEAQFNWPTLRIKETTFAKLGTPDESNVRYCSDCAATAPCTGSGTGAFAFRAGSTPVWNCNDGSGGGGGAGDVVGPASSTDNAVARYDLATGKLLQNSTVRIGDTGIVTLPSGGSVAQIGVVSGDTIDWSSGAAGPRWTNLDGAGVYLAFDINSLLADHTATWPNKSGTVAFTSDIVSTIYCVVAANQTNGTTTPQTAACYRTTAGSVAISLSAGRTYTGQCTLIGNDSVAADGFSVDYDGGTATATTFSAFSKVTDTALLKAERSTTLANDVDVATATGDTEVRTTFYLKVSAAGTFQPRFFKTSHTTGTLTLYEGAHCTLVDATP